MVIVGIFDHFLPYSVQSREFHSSDDPVGGTAAYKVKYRLDVDVD